MKKFSYSLLFIAAIGLAACGGKQESNQKESFEYEDSFETDDDESVSLLDDEDADDSTTDSNEVTNADTEKIDKMLDNYEEMIDEYDKLITKLKSGNADMATITSFATKAASMQEDLDDYKSQMTPAQVKRMDKLVTKFSNVAMKATGVNMDAIESIGNFDVESLF